MAIDNLKYPIGHYERPESLSDELLESFIEVIATFPAQLRNETESLSDQQLDTPYRENGWTIRQVVNHCADSHMNCLTRFKLALTEDRPTIKPYNEAQWAELADSKTIEIEPALKMLEGIHLRWVTLLKSLTDEEFNKSFLHPEHEKEMKLSEVIGLYAWHCKHHLAHITSLKSRKKW
ncbi:YfiT family bacillithiol transferase [Pontibacter pudoricolor]|uniref:YfiT family bacillithiol transferase n=1 Tax=Pontibacter pudoricolor TaxID=2694930 RepID=UPI001391F708|nr:bacillithiol transferase BstA [Pontibacter pudoricolor]